MASAISSFVPRMCSSKCETKHKEENREFTGVSNYLENICMQFYRVMIWEDPIFSTVYIILVNIVFWLIIYFNFKCYQLISLALLYLIFDELWVNRISHYIWKKALKSSPGDDGSGEGSDSGISCAYEKSFKRCQALLRDIFNSVKLFRRKQPGLFCTFVCICFLLLSFVGKSLSDITSIYILLMLTMTVPGDNANNDYNDFLPETSPEVLEFLSLAGDVTSNKNDDQEPSDGLLECISARTNDTAGSFSSKLSFYPESSCMPSPEHSIDFFDFDPFAVDNDKGHKSKLNDNTDLNYLSKHFDGDGYSTDEDEFLVGLKFSKESGKNFCSNNVEDNQSNQGSNTLDLHGNQLGIGASNRKKVVRSDGESSSDTDSFEIISEKDM